MQIDSLQLKLSNFIQMRWNQRTDSSILMFLLDRHRCRWWRSIWRSSQCTHIETVKMVVTIAAADAAVVTVTFAVTVTWYSCRGNSWYSLIWVSTNINVTTKAPEFSCGTRVGVFFLLVSLTVIASDFVWDDVTTSWDAPVQYCLNSYLRATTWATASVSASVTDSHYKQLIQRVWYHSARFIFEVVTQ